MPIIETNSVGKKYKLGKNTVHALCDISICIEKGEHVCITGPSGAGKSTLLNILGLLDSVSTGEICFAGKRVTTLKQKEIHDLRKYQIGFVFQNFNLIPVLSAYENIEFPLIIQGKMSVYERRKRISYISDEVGINDYLKHKPDELSGGQRQRVAIARALITNPNVVIADEPTANLDTINATVIMDLMNRLNKDEKITFIIATHDQKLLSHADREITIIDGRIHNNV